MKYLVKIPEKILAVAYLDKVVLGEKIKPEGNILELYHIPTKNQ